MKEEFSDSRQVSLLVEVQQVTVGGSESGGESEPGSLFRWELGERERAEVGSGKGSTRLSLPRRVERDGWLVTTTHTEKHTPSHRLQGDRYLGVFHFLQSTAKLLTERESSKYELAH